MGEKKEERAKNFLCNSLKSASVCSLRVPRISFAELARNSGLSFFVGFIFFVFFFFSARAAAAIDPLSIQNSSSFFRISDFGFLAKRAKSRWR